ncbi:hypothetical protein Lalb_Chr06g0174251 [Lupinus albus]|uniref:Uncharacterized protein n=1 Tax=Lupinus albus TaxID=3870 RepID=A0A6A4QF15_LUPAL|nr:hypothetical protein Lalb_Chr06g0174251 [Lupinus albus]
MEVLTIHEMIYMMGFIFVLDMLTEQAYPYTWFFMISRMHMIGCPKRYYEKHYIRNEFILTIFEQSRICVMEFILVLNELTDHIQESMPRCIIFLDDFVLIGNGEMYTQTLEAHDFRRSQSKTIYGMII